MPYSYQFHTIAGGIASLNDVDRELCEKTGVPYSERNYCPAMVDFTQWLGMSILRHSGGSIVTPEAFDSYREMDTAKPEDRRCFGHYGPTEWTIAREFLAERYRLEMWYSH